MRRPRVPPPTAAKRRGSQRSTRSPPLSRRETPKHQRWRSQRIDARSRGKCSLCEQMRLMNEQKRALHSYYTVHPDTTHKALGEWAPTKFALPVALSRTTALGILKCPPSSKMLNPSRKANYSVQSPQLNATLVVWVSICEDSNVPIANQAAIRGKAEQLREVMLTDTALPARMPSSARTAPSEMMFSGGWLEKLQRRYHLASRPTHGEAASVQRAAVEKGRIFLQNTTSTYAKCDVFNMDETAVFFCTAPPTSLSNKQFAERKKLKKRPTVAVADNADGSIRLPLLFVGTAAKPCCFGGKSGAEHGLDYCSSPKDG